MRRLAAAAVISAALHGAALAWIASAPPKPVARPTVSVQLVPAPVARPADPEPTEVVLLEDDTPPPTRAVPATSSPSPVASVGHSHAAAASLAISTGHPGGGIEVPAGPGHEGAPGGTGHSPLMTMRGPEVSQGLSTSFVDNFLASSKPPEQPVAPTGELHPSGGGTFRSEHPTFTAHVHADGTVSLHDEGDVDVHPTCLLVGCKMALDDALMRKYGIDPYAAAKLQWLDKTRDERAAIGMAHRKQVLAHAALYMQQNLAWVWARVPDADGRKRALFELWDDVAETGDAELVRAGADARAYLVGFVRAHLPAGTPEGYTAGELARLNAHRASRRAFAPYE